MKTFPRQADEGRTASDSSVVERYRGCLLGGAVGDALGAAVEFLSLDEIKKRFGRRGITDFAEIYGRIGAITDDTQMTMFTAEGVLRAASRMHDRGVCDPAGAVARAYHRWLLTQSDAGVEDLDRQYPGWLIGTPDLHAVRAPGKTCLTALMTRRPVVDSKGCGGVMRAAPAGMAGHDDPFRFGCEVAAITHGHPSGYLAAGALALMISKLTDGVSLDGAVQAARERIAHAPHHEEVLEGIDRAIAAARKRRHGPWVVEKLGGGWVAEETLSIAIYCALVAGRDFARGVRLAVNHSGDSDSTGAITGNILGALLGVDSIPARWIRQVEMRREIAMLADDLAVGYRHSEEWQQPYPPN